jgi:hypothetical protein
MGKMIPGGRGFVLAAILAILPFFPVSGDVITLKNGEVLKGSVVEKGSRYLIVHRYGKIIVPKTQVARIETEESLLEAYRRKKRDLGKSDIRGRLALARWCRSRYLPDESLLALLEVLRIDPDQKEAREALGYVKFKDRWMTPDQRWAAMGLVQYRGRWVTTEKKQDLQRKAREEARRRAAQRKKRARRARPETRALAAHAALAPSFGRYEFYSGLLYPHSFYCPANEYPRYRSWYGPGSYQTQLIGAYLLKMSRYSRRCYSSRAERSRCSMRFWRRSPYPSSPRGYRFRLSGGYRKRFPRSSKPRRP